MATVEFLQKRVAGKEKGIKTLERIKKAEASNWEKNPYHYRTPIREAIKYQPYDVQLYLQNSYNFIMEFEFDTDKIGHGCMYAVEYKR